MIFAGKLKRDNEVNVMLHFHSVIIAEPSKKIPPWKLLCYDTKGMDLISKASDKVLDMHTVSLHINCAGENSFALNSPWLLPYWEALITAFAGMDGLQLTKERDICLLHSGMAQRAMETCIRSEAFSDRNMLLAYFKIQIWQFAFQKEPRSRGEESRQRIKLFYF